MNNLIYVLIVGAISGWLAGEIKRGFGFGLIGNIIVGIIGAFVGNWVFGQLHISLGAGLIGVILTSVIGALIVLALIGLIRRWLSKIYFIMSIARIFAGYFFVKLSHFIFNIWKIGFCYFFVFIVKYL